MKYYKKGEVGKVVYTQISNGFILTDISSGGYPIANNHLQVFVTEEELKRDWEEFTYNLPIEERNIKIARRVIKDLNYQITNYGINEEMAMAFDEYFHTHRGCSFIEELVKFSSKENFKKWIKSETDELSRDFDTSFDTEQVYIMANFYYEIYTSIIEGNK